MEYLPPPEKSSRKSLELNYLRINPKRPLQRTAPGVTAHASHRLRPPAACARAWAAPPSAVAELGVVRRCYTYSMKRALFIICLSALALKAPAGDAPMPSVEVDFTSMEALEWSGRRLAEIVPPDSIKRIILTQESTWLSEQFRNATPAKTQSIYDALLAHFFASKEKAGNWQLGGNERTLAELMILTANGEMFRLEIVGTIGNGKEKPSAIFIHGRNKGARFKVKDFKFPNPKQ